MIEGRYRIEAVGEKPTAWKYNMITDKGYDFWTKGDATLSGNYVKNFLIGPKPEGISNLNPESSIEALQTVASDVKSYILDSYSTSLKKSQTSGVITHKFTVNAVERFQVLSEIGLGLDNVAGTLVTYSLFKSTEGLDIIPTMVEDKYPYSSSLTYELNIRVPFITKTYETLLLDNEVETNYKVSISLLDTLAASSDSSFSLRNPFKFSARMLGESSTGTSNIAASEVRLSSYNKLTKEATYNIVFKYDGAWVKSPSKHKTINIISSLGDYNIVLLDPLDDLNKGFPDTLAKDLIIPFKVFL